MNTKVIEIKVSGPVQSGKSSVVSSIESLLEELGYGVVILGRAERYDRSNKIQYAAEWERPDPDNTVFVIREKVE